VAEPPGRAAGGTAPVIVVGLDGSPASGRRLRDPCRRETERPPAPVFVVPPLASQLGMPPVTPSAERSTMEAGPPIRAESDWAVSAAPTVNDRPAPIRYAPEVSGRELVTRSPAVTIAFQAPVVPGRA
jgi:hypothetical protein